MFQRWAVNDQQVTDKQRLTDDTKYELTFLHHATDFILKNNLKTSQQKRTKTDSNNDFTRLTRPDSKTPENIDSQKTERTEIKFNIKQS